MILTSGTTGTPKGAPRNEAGIDAAVSLMSRLPLRYGWRTHIAAPLFHTWGFAHLALAMLLGSTVVLRRRFDPEGALAATQDERCQSLVVIPVMLQRILALPEETLAAYDLSRVEVVAASGSALPGTLALSWMDHFGDHLYNIYGSTEVAYASVATPEDLREAPSSAGRPPHATVVRIFDEDDQPVPDGETGRIFVGNSMLFEGYTGGGGKDMIEGLMSTGDVGRIGDDGRLYVEGRDDEMIVSGGENVFPQEVEDCLVGHEAVAEAAAIGVDDDDYGKRLRAFVVRPRPGSRSPRTTCASTSRPTWPATRCRATSSSSTSCPATRPARCSSRSSPSRPTTEPGPPTADRGPGWKTGATMTGLSLGGLAPDFTLRDQFGQDVTLSVLPRHQGGGAAVLPVRLLRRLLGRDGGAPRPARRVPDLRHRGARDLLRPGLLAARVRRPGRAELPAALGLLAARRGVERLRRLRRDEGLPAPLVVRRRPRRHGPLVGPQRRSPRGATSTSTCASSAHWCRPPGRSGDEGSRVRGTRPAALDIVRTSSRW